MLKKIISSALITLAVFGSQISLAASSTSFSDVDNGNANFNAVDTVVNQYKVMSGFPDNTFKGDSVIDRYTYSTIMLKTIEVLNKKMQEIEQKKIYDTQQTTEAMKFNNIADIKKDHWAYESSLSLLRLGLIRTYSDNTFRGDKTVDYLGFAIGMGRIMNIVQDVAPPVLKRKWEKDFPRKVTAIKGIPQDSPVFEPLKIAIENNLVDIKQGNDLFKPTTRYEIAEYLSRLINKLEEVRKYIVFSRI